MRSAGLRGFRRTFRSLPDVARRSQSTAAAALAEPLEDDLLPEPAWEWPRNPTNAPAPPAPRVHNFSSGPAQLPESVLERARDEFMSWPDAPGQSPMCISHRDAGGPYQQMQMRCEGQLRAMLDVPDNYSVVFMQGGAHGQFSAVPLNLLGGKPTISSVDTGFWARRAAAEMSKYAAIDWAASADPKADLSASAEPLDWRTVVPSQFTRMPDASTWRVADDAGFVHLCANETIGGVELLDDPDLPALSPSSSSSKPPPVVADFTSCLLSRHVDVSKYGVLYCSGGKNLGPAGLTLALVRDDLLDGSREHPLCPSVLSYKTLSSSKPIGSIYATPPTYGIYMLSLVLDDLHARGGLRWAAERTARLAGLVYDAIDASGGFYTNPVEPASRSRISVPFGVTGGGGRSPGESAELERRFLAEASQAGFRHLAGHPIAGGARVSIYNGVPERSVEALADFMYAFRRAHQ